MSGLTYYTLPKGEYWIGDLINVFRPMGREDLVQLLYMYEGCVQPKMNSAFSFVTLATMVGDGMFTDQYGWPYEVDSGSIGCISTKHVPLEIMNTLRSSLNKDNIPFGLVYSSQGKMVCHRECNVLTFGKRVIDTKKDEEE